jgi:hypothetical protein
VGPTAGPDAVAYTLLFREQYGTSLAIPELFHLFYPATLVPFTLLHIFTIYAFFPQSALN